MDIEKIQMAANKLVGLHNFRNFCKIDKNEKKEKNFERRIYEFSLHKVDKLFSLQNVNDHPYLELYYVVIKGSAFLWHQVRCMMAILFLIGRGLEEIELLDILLDDKYITESTKISYEIAPDTPLILTNCQYEGVRFRPSNLSVCAENVYRNSKSLRKKCN